MNHLNDSDKSVVLLMYMHCQDFILLPFAMIWILVAVNFSWAEHQVKDSRCTGLSCYFHPKLILFIGAKLVIVVHE